VTGGPGSISENQIPELLSVFLITSMHISFQSSQTKGVGSNSSALPDAILKGSSTYVSASSACEIQPEWA